jgi:hypothetical protein
MNKEYEEYFNDIPCMCKNEIKCARCSLKYMIENHTIDKNKLHNIRKYINILIDYIENTFKEDVAEEIYIEEDEIKFIIKELRGIKKCFINI